MYHLCKFLILILCIYMLVDVAVAQDEVVGSATIRGEVIDNSLEENPLEGAKVTITNLADGEEHTTLTDKHGMYAFKGLIPGRYAVKCSKDGYWDKIGPSKVAPRGGEVFIRISMNKVENIASFLLKELFTWQLFLGIAIGAIVVLILLSLRSRI